MIIQFIILIAYNTDLTFNMEYFFAKFQDWSGRGLHKRHGLVIGWGVSGDCVIQVCDTKCAFHESHYGTYNVVNKPKMADLRRLNFIFVGVKFLNLSNIVLILSN